MSGANDPADLNGNDVVEVVNELKKEEYQDMDTSFMLPASIVNQGNDQNNHNQTGTVGQSTDADKDSEEEEEDEGEKGEEDDDPSENAKKQTFRSTLGSANEQLAFAAETQSFAVVDCDTVQVYSHVSDKAVFRAPLKNCYAAMPKRQSEKGLKAFTVLFGKLFEEIGFQKPKRGDKLALWILPKQTDLETVSLNTETMVVTREPRHGTPSVMTSWLTSKAGASTSTNSSCSAMDTTPEEVPEEKPVKDWFLEKHYAHLVR